MKFKTLMAIKAVVCLGFGPGPAHPARRPFYSGATCRASQT